MNPNYRVQIDVCLITPIADKSIWLRLVKNIPFVPRSDDTIRLTSEDEVDTLDFSCDGVVYDAAAGLFIVDITDETLKESYSDVGTFDPPVLVDQYRRYGFDRVNFPTGQAVR